MLSSYWFFDCFILFGSSDGGRGACPHTRLKRTWKLILCLSFHHPLTLGSLLCVEMFGPKVRALFFWSGGLQSGAEGQQWASLSLGIHFVFFFFVFLPLLLLKSFLETGDGLSSKWINVYLNLNSQIARQELLPHLYESQTWIMIIKKVDEMSRLCHKISSGLCFSLELSTVCLYLVPTGISS